jgi:hypothetical protein
MKIPRMIFPAAFLLLLAHGLVFPSLAIAQHSASASETVRFAVLPVHTAASVLASPSARSEKVTVSLSLPADGPHGSPWTTSSDARAIPNSLPLPRAQGTSLIVTITD